ncbi:steroid 5-alpha reductase family enzyme [Actinocorallia herbida]|uniref:Steroid 5-alpha reductase family enzyme n=1 Tax=Actinocorallia herbida TaxID=58109 RepID=A0A3N1CSQ3_9ACTN|nr:steroid 5-alpha reductase family enzyme [Actinocorallia herbida]
MLWLNLVASAAAIAVLMGVTYALGVRKGSHALIDITWGAAFSVVALVSLALSAGHGDPVRRWTVAALTVVWGMRLAVHLGRRNWDAKEDPRYTELLSPAPPERRDRYAIRKVYLPQGVSVLLVSLPVQVAMYQTAPPGVFLWLGAAVWAVGLGFEALGDRQLAAFKADPANRGRVLDTGLWRYTRHPNYFGDALVWFGLFLTACDEPLGLLTVVSPLAMLWFLTRVTGVRLSDARMADRKPGYREYMARTSAFVPRPPRRRP